MMRPVRLPDLGWAWLILVASALVVLAWETRYAGGYLKEYRDADVYYVWDRWGHRLCGHILDEDGDRSFECYPRDFKPPSPSPISVETAD